MTTLRDFLTGRSDLVAGLRPLAESAQWDETASWLNEQIQPVDTVTQLPQPRRITAAGIMSAAALGADRGAAFLDALHAAAEVSSPVKYALKALDGEGIDLGDPATRDKLDELAVAGAIQEQDAADLKALAPTLEHRTPGTPAFAGWPVTELDIRIAWFLDNGDLAFPA
jgi:hypothetical protein